MIAANVGVPVSQMDDTYVKESATLSEAIIKYGTLDLYDPQRVQVINVSSHSGRPLLAIAYKLPLMECKP